MKAIADVEPGFEPGTRRRILAGVALLLAVIVAMALLVEHDAAGQVPDADRSIGSVLRNDGYLAGFALIYIEESGLPLFIPGDAFLLYVGHRLPHNVPVLVAAWLGFVLAVTLGATNLYLVSRRYGRRLLEHPLAKWLHITPARLAAAEQWFGRWGPWTLIVGRHIPGFRVPLTVAAGVLKLSYPAFALSVVVSSSVWAGVFLMLGVLFGNRLEHSVRSAPFVFLGATVAAIAVVVALALIRRRTAPEGARN
jgi:membrane protein DedA with SNARE-associated domain